MKKMRLLSLVPLMMAGAVLSGCNNTDYRVGICQLITHDALDAATNGFIDSVKARLQDAGKTVYIDLQNASGDSAVCSTIANKFVAGRYDLILANATPALQATMASTDTIPILGTSITDYSAATGLPLVDGALNCNISGTSDLAPLESQAEMINELYPSSNNIGIIYCSSEANSQYQANIVRNKLESMGKSVSYYTFADSNELPSIVNNACNNCDILYAPTDNVVASNSALIHSICAPKNIPVITGDDGTCKGCGLAVLAINYYELGRKTGNMAADILLNGSDIKKMKIQYDDNPYKKYNPSVANELGYDIQTLEQLGYEALNIQ